jgi:hypothetical protein
MRTSNCWSEQRLGSLADRWPPSARMVWPRAVRQVRSSSLQNRMIKPVVIPVGRLEAKLIEGPVVVRAPAVQPIAAVPS